MATGSPIDLPMLLSEMGSTPPTASSSQITHYTTNPNPERELGQPTTPFEVPPFLPLDVDSS